uniref:Putative ubiquinone oxidoreductase n=1 Tax=Hyalomma excavatum TaxID=257692 RepID=A0A131XKR0_9ACAR
MLIRSPFSDLVSVVAEGESNRNCQKLSMQLALCREAYGMHRADEKCKDEYEDFKECIFGFKQRARVFVMQQEREKQFKNGERKEKYAEMPPVDGFAMRDPFE